MALEQKDNVIPFPDFVEKFDLGNWFDLQRQKTEINQQCQVLKDQRQQILEQEK
tara:strand:+ start:1054 stop:1215 length:162 start_codon:yes stop_codon:yes gene_type:complete